LLGERLFERPSPLAYEHGPLDEARAFSFGNASNLGRACRLVLEVRRSTRFLRVTGLLGSLAPKSLEQRGGSLTTELEPFDATLKSIESGDRSLAATRRIGEFVLGARPIREQPFETRLRTAPCESGSVSSTLGLRAPLAGVGEIQLCDAGTE
jgi:hypothetical protein